LNPFESKRDEFKLVERQGPKKKKKKKQFSRFALHSTAFSVSCLGTGIVGNSGGGNTFTSFSGENSLTDEQH